MCKYKGQKMSSLVWFDSSKLLVLEHSRICLFQFCCCAQKWVNFISRSRSWDLSRVVPLFLSNRQLLYDASYPLGIVCLTISSQLRQRNGQHISYEVRYSVHVYTSACFKETCSALDPCPCPRNSLLKWTVWSAYSVSSPWGLNYSEWVTFYLAKFIHFSSVQSKVPPTIINQWKILILIS